MDIARLKSNLDAVRRRMEAACRRVGRDPAGVTLVAVTKSVDVATMRRLAALGVRDLAENRAIEGAARAAEAGVDVTWHFVGHLQTNKVRACLERFRVVHSVDRESLAGELEKRAAGAGIEVAVFAQANVSGEASKDGVRPEGLPDLIARLRASPHLRLRGLMTMAPAEADPERTRPVFRRLRALAQEHGLPELSMGMTNDFEVAIEEGATLVRVGTALFVEQPEARRQRAEDRRAEFGGGAAARTM